MGIWHGKMEIKWKLEMETGNGNWKRKWEQKCFAFTPILCFVITAFRCD